MGSSERNSNISYVSGNALLISMLYIGTFPPPEGGVRVGVRLLANELASRDDVQLEIVDISCRGSLPRRAIFYLKQLTAILIGGRHAQLIVFSAPTNYTLVCGGIVFLISRLLRLPLVIRNSAGHNDKIYASRGPLGRLLMRKTTLSAEMNLFQTQYQADYFQDICAGKVGVFPNHRKPPRNISRPVCERATRFVFMGRLEPQKGADFLVDTFRDLGHDIILDLYGEDRLGIEERIQTNANITYKGSVENCAVYDVLKDYDALILPSIEKGEGHPGVIVESFLVGLPVIATSLPGIAEIVTDGVNGLLIPSNDRDELKKAILRLNTDSTLYQHLRKNIEMNRGMFSSEYWSDVFVQKCQQLVRSQGANSIE